MTCVRILIVALLALTLVGCEMGRDRYVELLTTADSALRAKQDRLERDFQFGSYPRYDYDEATGVFVFSADGQAKVLADAKFVGVVSRRDSTWTWSWNLPYVSADLSASARKARWYGWVHGVDYLKHSGWSGDQVDGWEMTSLTAWIAGAEGAYRAPSADSSEYTLLLLDHVRWAPAGRSVASYIVSTRE
jgi:hypothetical protein